MALTNRPRTVSGYGTAAGTGTLAALLLVGVGGSPAYVGWVQAHTDPNGAGGWFLRLLAWPAWRLHSDDPAHGVFATDLRAVLMVILAAALLYLLPASQVARVQGSVSQFFSGWAAYVLAGGFTGLLAALLGPDGSLLAAFQAASTGATYGFFAGWIVGAASLGGRA
ncbi:MULTISPECIES: hypothetical protein [Micromonospora]|jgi:hypothetical protein|uniref:Uncharacterized protein n=1 Tax=Micromonospora sicca TaxID=2202420 RepID=A0A317DQU7_9ACTN|nr:MULTISPECIES: hypothetical protein [unclassified Micromonospora]MBM0227848.1 hypothetical protein [Micromonospora sp. ATA51]MDZ5441234.1 hypothetical protein [Micromonospora sp. 4G57]MDZ5491460.1 hypothetical protein [Micromonospora sp. 4G53]PWR16724.1 hypothetical protein DKT69_04085 [Micromonospora sp. 4G51]